MQYWELCRKAGGAVAQSKQVSHILRDSETGEHEIKHSASRWGILYARLALQLRYSAMNRAPV
jgi:hypothetical protein